MNNLKCNSCNQNIDSSFNICPFCGEPLNDLSKDFFKNQEKVSQLKLLYSLAGIIEDKDSLNKLNAVIDQIKNK